MSRGLRLLTAAQGHTRLHAQTHTPARAGPDSVVHLQATVSAPGQGPAETDMAQPGGQGLCLEVTLSLGLTQGWSQSGKGPGVETSGPLGQS